MILDFLVLEKFKEAVKAIVAEDERLEDAYDYQGSLTLIRSLYNALTPAEFERLVTLLRAAQDPDVRSPK